MGARGVAGVHRFSVKDADEAQTRDLLLARHLLEFRSLDQKGTCRVVAVARERQMPEAVLGAILETYAQASKTAAGSYRYDCRAAPLQDALVVAVLFALLRAGGGRLRVEDAARRAAEHAPRDPFYRPRASSRPRGDRRAWRRGPCRAAARNSTSS